MQVVILAGGEGTRLRPLTSDTPKPLVRVVGISAIERLTALLFKSGFKEASVADFYLADKLESELTDFSNGIKLSYVREEIPLGTAGCVRKAWNGDDVLVVSGDSVCDFDFSEIVKFHYAHDADVTIVSHEVEDPREYGLVTADKDGRVVGFCEKPSYDSCLTDIANTGTYVISKKVMESIPECEDVDFAKDLFPSVLSGGGAIFTTTENGRWFDIGDIGSLIECQTSLLENENRECAVLEGASVGEGSSVFGGSVIESGATLGRSCRVASSLVMKGASLGDGCELDRCVICENVTVGRKTSFGELSAVGSGSVIGSSVTVDAGIRIAPNSKIPSGVRVRRNVSSSGYKLIELGERGSVHGIDFNSDSLLTLGKAISEAFSLESVTVGYERGTEAYFEPLALGLKSMGTNVYFLKDAAFGETVFAARRLKTRYCVYISDDSVKVMRSGVCELSRTDERKLCEKYNRGELRDRAFGMMINADAEREVYVRKLRELLPKRFAGSLSFRSVSERENMIFDRATKDLDWSRGERLTFYSGGDAFESTLAYRSGELPYEELLLLGCRCRLARGESIVLEQRAPLVCDEYAKAAGSEITRLFSSDEGELSQFSLDPLFLAAEVIRYLSEREISAAAARAELPDVFYFRKTADMGAGLPKLLRREFSKERKGADIVIENSSARAYVRPLKNGRELSMYVESVSQEAAESICGEILTRLKATDELDKRADL